MLTSYDFPVFSSIEIIDNIETLTVRERRLSLIRLKCYSEGRLVAVVILTTPSS